MIVVVVILSVLAGLLLALLVLPVSVVARGAAGDDELWGVAELRWAFRAAAVQLSSDAGARVLLLGVPVYRVRWRRGEKKKKKPKRKQREAKKGSDASLMQSLGPDRRAAMRMLRRGVGALHPHMYVGGTMGLGAPDRTALLLTAVQQINALTPEQIEIDLHDDYLSDSTQLFGRLRAWVVPAELGLVLLGWLIRSDTRRVLRRAVA